MSAYIPSIFNDVIGPVMRGPSSSHVAAALRIGQIARYLMGGSFDKFLVRYDTAGSLATTHDGQGSDIGLFSGLLGWDATEERMNAARSTLEDSGVDVEIAIGSFGTLHPNTYLLTLQDQGRKVNITAISTGGGMIDVIEIDGVNLSIKGDYHETLFWLDDASVANDLKQHLVKLIENDEVNLVETTSGALVQLKGQQAIDADGLEYLKQKFNILHVMESPPVLPIRSSREMNVPFIDTESMLTFNQGKDLSLWQLALEFESARGGISKEDVFEKMRTIVRILNKSIAAGIEGTSYNDRILPAQAPAFKKKMDEGGLMSLDLYNQVILSVTALMDVKSAFGVIVAAPTAGSCGTLPGTCLGVANALDMPEDEAVKAMLAAGLIGVFIAHSATFAAEVGGCQAETGSGSGMAAAALVTQLGGTLSQAVAAASMALQNTFGMVCDPIANRVEAPCLGKNVITAGNALSCANMALAGFEHLIPLDEVIEAMHKVGQSLPCELRCTGKGGLATTKTALEIEARIGQTAE